jgi:ankyrin repeat protein
VNRYGASALSVAASHGFLESVDTLLKGGADVNLFDNEGKPNFSHE